MAINPLPQSTIELLGSAQTLTNSFSLVKELVDNALDAKATAIDVLISKDTVEKIEVRDNGHGIPQNDFTALGRRGHTSKLRSFDELRSIGGMSLGFRGEALASAVQLGEVTVTTKTEGESVATCLLLKAPNGAFKQTRTSHPIGTTVCVKNFLSKIPVRKQTALKSAPKALVQVKQLLTAFAFARPATKFSLKVAKESRGAWSFVPRATDGIKGAAIQLIGRDAIGECLEKTLTFSDVRSVESARQHDSNQHDLHLLEAPLEHTQFTVEILLPKPSADVTKISHGQYFSIDSRPVANDKGTMKRIVSLFKAYLKGTYGGSPTTLQNPFLRMSILCPTASYDPNVEPAKDDILFSNERLILESIESFFKDIYGEPKSVNAPTRTSNPVKQIDDFELMLARRPQAPLMSIPDLLSGSVETTGNSSYPPIYSLDADCEVKSPSETRQITESVASHNGKWGVDMSTNLSEEMVENTSAETESDTQTLESSANITADIENAPRSTFNPWEIAKLTARVNRNGNISANLPVLVSRPAHTDNNLLTPGSSSDSVMPEVLQRTPTPFKKFLRRKPNSLCTSESIVGDQNCLQEEHITEAPHERRVGAFMKCRSLDLSLDKEHEAEHIQVRKDPVNDFISARSIAEEVKSVSTVSHRANTSNKKTVLNKPFVSPLLDIATPQNFDNINQQLLQIPKQNVVEDALVNSSHVSSWGLAEDEDLAWAMDFENRKEELNRQQRQRREVARSRIASESENTEKSIPTARPSPHKNRYVAALASLESGAFPANRPPVKPVESLISDGDPRLYLLRRQKSIAALPGAASEFSKPSRLKSNRLPLERVPAGAQLHSLAFKLRTNIEIIQALSDGFGEEDLYISSGTLMSGLELSDRDMPEVIKRFHEVVLKWKETSIDENVEFEYTLGSAITFAV